MRVAAIQHDIVWEDREPRTSSTLAPLIAAAAAAGARLVVLTEMFATGFSMAPDRVAEEPADGPTSAFLAEQAREHGVWICGSIARARRGRRACRQHARPRRPGRRRCTATRKIHPFSYAGEHEHYAAGDRLVTVDVEGVRCTPLRLLRPALRRRVLGPRARHRLLRRRRQLARGRAEHWRTLLRARAIENQAYVVGVNRVGTAGRTHPLEHAGDSVVHDPLGAVLGYAEAAETVLLADIAPAVVRSVREKFPFLADRRQFGHIATETP